MKLIKQAVLEYRDGKSDKVYEVDLCEVAAGQFVVNFRYGRRGSNLRDGTKTALPVDRTQAEKVFDKLVASKINKGYRDTTAAAPAARPGPERAGDRGEHAAHVLRHLRQPTDEWPLDRVIWRAGELAIAEAEPLLLEHLERGGPNIYRGGALKLRAYNIAWALGRCGGEASFGALRALIDRAEVPMVSRIAGEALRRLDPGYRDELAREIASTIPGADPVAFAGRLEGLIEDEAERAAQFLYPLYLIDSPEVRPGLIAALRAVPLAKPFFSGVRAIFKAAEFRGDVEIFGVAGYRFEKTPPNPSSWFVSDMPYKRPTRDYLRRRTWRTLRTFANDGSDEYVKWAVGVLLPFSDGDRPGVTSRVFYGYADGRWQRQEIFYAPFGGYWAFNQILYGNSERYVADNRGRFLLRDGVRRDAPPPRGREESFPEIWDRNPAALLHLLDESACEVVHEFAVKALRANKPALDDLDVDAIVMLLGRPYSITAELGFDLARIRYNPDDPDLELVRGVATCASPVARVEAHGWIRAGHRHFASDSALWAMLITSEHADSREFAREHLMAVGLDDDVARLVIARAIAELTELTGAATDHLNSAAITLLRLFPRVLRGVGEPVIRDLLAHPALPIQQLAAEILLGHETLGSKPPDDILMGLLGSEHPSIRGIGARLFGQLSDTDLLARSQLIVSLSTHEHADLRDAIRPALLRLVADHPELARELAASFARKLLAALPDGVPSHLVALLRDEMIGHLGEVDKDLVMRLLKAKSPHAQELGGLLLSQLQADDLAMSEIISLASHDIREVRRGSWSMIERNMDRLRLAMQGAVRLLDAKWEDSREWARDLFENKLGAAELTPPILVAICDSIRPDVQAFGKQLIGRYFAERDGAEYLLKLSEHPTSELQRFATTYLEGHAAGNPARLAELEPFFVTVLSRVYKGRVAKQRVIAFLAAEAQKSREAAAIAARVFARQSATMAITQKEPMIAAMVDIARRYPDLAVPITFVEAPLREAAGGAEP